MREISNMASWSQVGMRLLEVNGSNVIGVTRREAIDAFRRAGHVLRLMVCDGWNNENTGTAKLVDSDDVMSNRSSVISNSSRTERRGSVSSVRHQQVYLLQHYISINNVPTISGLTFTFGQVHPSKQPNVSHNGLDDNGSTKSTPSVKKVIINKITISSWPNFHLTPSFVRRSYWGWKFQT